MLDYLTKISRLKFRLLTASMAAVLFLVVVLATYGIHSKAVRAVEEECRGEELAIARSGAVMLERFFSTVFNQMENLGRLAEVQSFTTVENSAAFRALYYNLREYVECVSRIDESGRLVTGYRGDFEPVETGHLEVFRDEISEDLVLREKHVSKPELRLNGEFTILLSYPVFSKDQGGESSFAGMLLAEIKPEKLIEVVSVTLKIREEDRFTIIDPDGEVIGSSCNPTMLGNNVFDEKSACVECHSDISSIGNIVRSGGGIEFLNDYQTPEEMAAYVRMDGDSPGWLVGVHSDYSAEMGSVRAISRYALLIAIACLVILFPGMILLFMLSQKREEAEGRTRYLEKEKKLLEKLRDADREIGGHNRELSVLNELASEVNKSLVLRDVLSISIDKTLESTTFENGGIYLLEAEEDILILKECRGIPEETRKSIDRILVGQSLTGRVAEKKEAVFVESMVSDPRCEIEILKKENYHSYAGIPLMHGSTLVGVMGLGAKKVIRLNNRKQQWLKSIGSIIGMAIGNCMLYHEVRTKAEEMSILYDVGRDLTSTIEISKLGEIVVSTLKNRLEYPACTLLLPDRASKAMRVFVTSYDMDKGTGKREFEIGKDGVTGWVAQTKETLYVPDVTKENRYIKGREETRAELSIPLVFGDELLGILDFEKDTKNSFSEDEIRFLSLFANQLAVALYNVNMFEETMRMNKELNRMSEMKSEFVSLVSHELRTPLTAIKSSIDIILLKMSETLSENVSYFLSIAKANVDRLSNMIDNLLDISRIESGRMQFSLASLDIKDPARKAVKNLTPLAMQKGLQIEDYIVEGLPMVMADGGKVEQVFTNLIGNAIKYTPKGGIIKLQAEKKTIEDLTDKARGKISNGHTRFIQITVEDNGPGIPENEHEEIFKRFRRVEKGGGKGTGLGLAISKHFVESHGGGVWVESEPGRGSSFKFLIPLSKEEPSEN